MGDGPDMEFFLFGLFVSVNLVLWATALLATYIGLKISKSTAWNPKMSVVSKNPVSLYHSMGQEFLGDGSTSDDDNNNNNSGATSGNPNDLLYWE